jgi:hypothetical protein
MEQWTAAHGALVTSRGEDIPWSARSPDLSVCYYIPWWYVKSKVYVTKPSDVDELQYAIKGETAATPDKYIGQCCCLMCDMFPRISHHQSVVKNA